MVNTFKLELLTYYKILEFKIGLSYFKSVPINNTKSLSSTPLI